MDAKPEQLARLGRYELVEALGLGGMGAVYRARAYAAAGVTKEVCVKRIRPERLGEGGMVQRFIAEARVSMGLTHANIVPVFDFGRADDGYFLAMEWVEGADLRAILEDGPLPPIVAAYVGAAIARALGYAHGARGGTTVHRDVKPANVLVSLSGDVKLADFGVAALVGDARGVAGTLAYMAPEQREGADPTPAGDLYSLGILLRKMLDPPEPLRALIDSLTRDSPAQRATDADQVADALEHFLATERVAGATSPRETLRERARDARRRGEPVRDVMGAELSFLRDGHDATFSTQMRPSPTPRSSARWLLPLILVLVAAVVGIVVWPEEPALSQPEAEVAEAEAEAVAEAETEVEAQAEAETAETEAETEAETAETEAEAETEAVAVAETVAEVVDPPRTSDTPQMGSLAVNVVPWAHVFVDGRALGETPVLDAELPVGSHVLRLVNEPMGVTREMRVEISETPTRIVVRLGD